MLSSTPIIDIHSHSTLKPYGNSFYKNLNPEIATNLSCIWAQDKHRILDTVYEISAGISRYRQSDYKTLVNGQTKIVFTSLYPTEIGFFQTRQDFPDKAERFIGEFASLFSYDRIDYVMGNGDKPYNYFEDLLNEYKFLKLLSGRHAIGGSLQYHLIANASQLNTPSNLLVIPTIEGAHVFCNGTDVRNPRNWDNVEARIQTVKNWEHPPIFITIAHHFFNGLCTHAKSLTGLAGDLLDQSYGMRDYEHNKSDNEPAISDTGKIVIRALLSNQNSKRILIDIKHMSLDARKEYYKMLENEFSGQSIPIVCSHGALDNFYKHEVNMNLSTDVLQIYKTNGLFGLEMDQRILGYDDNRFIKWTKGIFQRKQKREYLHAMYFWQNLISIAEFAYQNGFSTDPWKCICMGSDYDGIINPLNTYRDAETLPNLYNYLIEYLNDYWKDRNSIIPKHHGGWKSEDVIYRIMYKNAYEFIERNY